MISEAELRSSGAEKQQLDTLTSQKAHLTKSANQIQQEIKKKKLELNSSK